MHRPCGRVPVQGGLAQHYGLQSDLPQDPGKHIHDGRADHLEGGDDDWGTGVDTEEDQLQLGPPHPHAAEHGQAIGAPPHEGEGHSHQDHEDVVGHQLSVAVADAEAVHHLGGDGSVGVLLDAGIKFQLEIQQREDYRS